MLKRFLPRGNRGDTIVEVLIVVVVLATVVGGAYSIAIRSQKANQQAQEHSQALKIAEGQLENLRSHETTIEQSQFCFAPNGDIIHLDNAIPSNAADDNFDNYVGCKQSPEGRNCDSGSGSFCYNVGITKTGDNYRVTVRWDGINGSKDNVSLFYRMPSL